MSQNLMNKILYLWEIKKVIWRQTKPRKIKKYGITVKDKGVDSSEFIAAETLSQVIDFLKMDMVDEAIQIKNIINHCAILKVIQTTSNSITTEAE